MQFRIEWFYAEWINVWILDRVVDSWRNWKKPKRSIIRLELNWCLLMFFENIFKIIRFGHNLLYRDWPVWMKISKFVTPTKLTLTPSDLRTRSGPKWGIWLGLIGVIRISSVIFWHPNFDSVQFGHPKSFELPRQIRCLGSVGAPVANSGKYKPLSLRSYLALNKSF